MTEVTESEVTESEVTESEVTELGVPVYECIKCGTKTTTEELSLLPEIKCICGYRILRKTRPLTAKTIKAI